jgi:type VI secretion system protein ImpA
MGSTAPGLIDLRAAVEDCRKLIKQILAQKGGGEGEGGEGATDGTGEGGVAGRHGSREQAYRQLAQAAALLRQLEPHSPIPYLIQRAVELGSMPFPQLIRALIREPNILSELNRELGIKESEGSASAPPPSG